MIVYNPQIILKGYMAVVLTIPCNIDLSTKNTEPSPYISPTLYYNPYKEYEQKQHENLIESIFINQLFQHN